MSAASKRTGRPRSSENPASVQRREQMQRKAAGKAKPPGRPPMAKQVVEITFHTDKLQADAIEAWRNKFQIKPSRAQALRELVRLGLYAVQPT